ncbi:MAG: RAMP superfamily protein [Phormidesmis sp. RL_2_1]|nr:RAMP superfamily protein [Phormidesmis sp. RL_2_1]
MTIPDAAKKVPMMYRAQVEGRSQLQRLVPQAEKQDAMRWAEEWISETYPVPPQFSSSVQTRTYALTWRFITNGGQDDGIIRPVIGARGWPFYPGSSMKGIFRQACTAAQADKYCGKADDQSPGILRFHGGYPTTDSWTENLVDLVHPQQDRQVKKEGKTSAFIQISLYQPELQFGISSTVSDEETSWETVWQIWEKAIASGLGSRVSAGYGQAENAKGDLLYRVGLKGQGQAAKLIDEIGEFRPNVFRAGIRGHALRIFGGLTDADTAENLVEGLFGGISGGSGTVGLLSMAFQTSALEMGSYGTDAYAQPTYDVEGTLRWLITRSVTDDKRQALTLLIESLTRFAMAFGGFGKSWRRADHRLIYPDYYDQGRKPLIGCHWQWSGNRALVRENRIRQLSQVATCIESVRQAAQAWMTLQGVKINPQHCADWREAWHPNTVQVWGRVAQDIEDSEAVGWLHGPYQRRDRTLGTTEQTIKQSSVTGQLGEIGRLWHRMYPWVNVTPNPDEPRKPNIIHTPKCFELLTLFPNSSTASEQFLAFLESRQDEFQKLWPVVP